MCNELISDDHSHVIATIGTTSDAAPLFTSDTVFWVVRPRFFAGRRFFSVIS